MAYTDESGDGKRFIFFKNPFLTEAVLMKKRSLKKSWFFAGLALARVLGWSLI
jgi:hypothetical protein